MVRCCLGTRLPWPEPRCGSSSKHVEMLSGAVALRYLGGSHHGGVSRGRTTWYTQPPGEGQFPKGQFVDLLAESKPPEPEAHQSQPSSGAPLNAAQCLQEQRQRQDPRKKSLRKIVLSQGFHTKLNPQQLPRQPPKRMGRLEPVLYVRPTREWC